MKSIVTKFFVGVSLCFLLISCGGGGGSDGGGSSDTDTSSSVTPDTSVDTGQTTTTKAKTNTATNGSWTVLIYICGSNLESRYGSASKNIEQILKANKALSTNIIIATGGSTSWKNDEISPFALDYYEVKDNALNRVKRNAQANMGESSTLSDFIAFGQNTYPANHYALIFWDHGGGSYKGVCFDENFDFDSLSLSEIDSALSQNSINLEFIGFDACLMSNIETMQMAKKYAKTMIASESVTPTTGWDYENFLASLNDSKLYEKALSSFEQKATKNDERKYSLAVIDLQNADSVISAFENLATNLQQKASTGLQPIVKSAINATSFGANSKDEGRSNLVDLRDFSDGLDDDTLSNAIDKYVASIKSYEQGNSGGISFYYPLKEIKSLSDYYENTNITPYKSFLQEYYSADKVKRMITMEDMGSNNGNELEFKVSSDRMKYIQSVSYKLYQGIVKDGKGYLKMYGEDTTIIQTDNAFKTRLDRLWYSFGDNLLRINIVDSGDGITEFSSPVKLNGNEGSLRFTYEYKIKKTKLLGFVDNDKKLMGRIVNLKPTDKITIQYEIGDGNDKDTSLKDQDTFTVGDLELKLKIMPDGNYLIVGFITDVYGNNFTTNGVELNIKDGVQEFVQVVPASSDGTSTTIYFEP